MLYINSPGGVVTSGLVIHDTMQYVRSTVSTTCLWHGSVDGRRVARGRKRRAGEWPCRTPGS
jgi:hypothetical protein